jgi:thioredoxin-related protein
MLRSRCILTALVLALLVLPAAARDDEKAKDSSKDKAAKSKPYDEKADARADIDKALKLAKKENQRVLIQWGGNWCGWCVLLHDRFKSDPGLKRELLYEYKLVFVDIGHMDKNQDLVKSYDAKIKGVPYLTMLDAEGKVVANQETEPFETKDDGKNGHDPKKLLTFLKEHEAKPLVAEEVLQRGLADASKTDRLVFLHFGAPWCGWCHRLEDWMARPEISAILAKEFVDVKIDNDRMTGAKEVFSRFNANTKGGIPWFVFLDAKGKPLATSDDAKGSNIGFPSEPAEIVHFTKMLNMARRKLGSEDVDQLAASLRAESKPGQ